MKRLNLALDDKTHEKLLELREWMNAASMTEVLRRAVEDLHRRESNRKKWAKEKPSSWIPNCEI